MTVTNCNAPDGKVAISARLNHSEKNYPEFAGGVATFNGPELVPSFEPGFLVLTKTLGSNKCDKETVDGVEVMIIF